MSTRLIKEARELGPVLAGTVALLLGPSLFWRGDREALATITMFIFGLGCAVMSALTFGSEFQHRTLGLLLSQPVRRSVLWQEKMAVLGTGLAINFVTAVVCVAAAQPTGGVPLEAVLVLGSILLCAFCGTPFLTLVVRSGLAGLVFAAVLPMAPAGLIAVAVTTWLPQVNAEYVVVSCLLVYCALMGWLGYRQFARFELKDGAGEAIALSPAVEGLLARALGWAVPRVTGPGLALVKKELRQQQVSFLLAASFLVLVALTAVVRWRSTDWGEGLFTLEYAIYLILLPFIVGAVAVAEERALGIAEWQLTFPVSAWKQWMTKMLVALPSAVLLGLLLPGLLYLVGLKLFHGAGATPTFPSLPEALWFLPIQLVATTVAVYTASVCGSTIRAILLAFGVVVAGGTILVTIANRMLAWGERHGHQLNNAANLQWALWATAPMVMLFVLQWLAFRNFRRCGLPGLGWIGQLALLLLSWATLVAANLAILLFS